MTPALRIAGVRCPCGSEDLTLVAPGSEPVRSDLIGLLDAGEPARGWCCVDHARQAGCLNHG